MKNKNILVVGGSSGIGLELVKQLASDNQLFVLGRNQAPLAGLDVHFISHDVTDGTDLDSSTLPERLDGFVYCPGSINLRPFKGIKPEVFQQDMEVNAFGAVRTLQKIAPLLMNSSEASIVFFSTVAVQTGMPFHSSIAMAKGALEGLTRSLAAEWAPKVRVNSIALSLVDTPLAAKFTNNADKLEKANARHPLGRMGSAADAAQMTVFLLSEKSSWMTGQILHLDGGIGNLKT
ncbi:SDR family oxidoreductase [Flavobacteriaceae bacterium]|jgi:3-oxoacyl-[acyl-carrier protein] reductase|nr:SDR family oxidoreductase [Flavobacteriaceae bacterium]MDA7711589.1 SDR family oxidoreductase [Flavobacteriaceae bacterium]MDA8900774.1 SDR family oxidoreductase [Flavobacteriaceae bacterium]